MSGSKESEESKEDPMIRDRKSLVDSGYGVVPSFLAHVFVVLPLVFAVGVPLACASAMANKVGNIISPPKKEKKKNDDVVEILANNTIVPPGERAYDVVLYGATGFTGKLAALYISKQYGKSVKWAIAGRRKDALEQVRAECLHANTQLSAEDVPIILADSTDYDSLVKMVAATRVVCTTAGPFDKYGSDLVKACAENGTSYSDITGESDWVRKMIDKYDEKARETGARIVHFCGHDCVPWDLAALECSNQLKKQGQRLVEIHCYDEIRADPSGGTMDTVFHSLGQRVKYTSKLGFDPLLKSLDKSKSQLGFSTKNQSILGYSKEYRAWVGPFVMAMVMANCVRRSHILNQYSDRLVYKEAVVYASFMAGVINHIQMLALGIAIVTPPLKWFYLATGMLPSPGEGPSVANMDQGFLKVTAFGTGDAGGKTKVQLYFPTDPGYRDTARMLVESGLVLALEAKNIKVGGGVFTPAACQGDLLTQRLLDTGMSMKVTN